MGRPHGWNVWVRPEESMNAMAPKVVTRITSKQQVAAEHDGATEPQATKVAKRKTAARATNPDAGTARYCPLRDIPSAPQVPSEKHRGRRNRFSFPSTL